MYLIKVWNNEGIVFEGYSKHIPKEGHDFKAWSINAVAVKSKVLSLNSQGLKLIFSIKTEI